MLPVFPSTVAGVSPLWLLMAVIMLALHRPHALRRLFHVLRLFSVFVHELSHGLAAIATGGSCLGITMDLKGNGLAAVPGGCWPITLSAGYLGTLLWGGVIMVFAARTSDDHLLSLWIGILMLGISLLLVRNRDGLIFGIGVGLVFVISSLYLPPEYHDYMLRLLGLSCCLDAIFDILDDGFYNRCTKGSDAHQMARALNLPLRWVGALWITIALIGTYCFLCMATQLPPAT